MRDLTSKLMTGSMIAAAALLVSACGSTKPAETNDANVTEVNATDDAMMNGTATDMMTNTDAGANAAAAMPADANAAAPAADAMAPAANAAEAKK